MKFTFASQTKNQAVKFQNFIKTDRNLDSSVSEKDGQFFVEYSVADFADKSCESKASDCYVKQCDFDEALGRLATYMFNEMQYQMKYLHAEVGYLSNMLYKHNEGHLPPIVGAGKMKKALDTLGLGEDYDVQKRVVYASVNSKGVPSLELDFPEAKK